LTGAALTQGTGRWFEGMFEAMQTRVRASLSVDVGDRVDE